MDLGLQPTLQHAVDHGIEAYITSRRARIPGFIDRHFSFRGALALHRQTFGRDVYKHPVNLVWGVPVALVHGAADFLDKAGVHRTAQWLQRMPRGFRRPCTRNCNGCSIPSCWNSPCAGGPGLAPRCTAGAHPGRTADCRAVRRVCDATAPRRGSARLPRRARTASGGVWQNPRRRLGTGRQLQGHSVFEFNTDESQCLHWLGSQPAASRRNVGMARPPQ